MSACTGAAPQWVSPEFVQMQNPRAVAMPLSQGIWNPVFTRIWAAIFLASVSTYFLLMTLAAKVFAGTGSALWANSVVLTQWLPAVAALVPIRMAVARHPPRALLVFCEVASAVLLLLVPFSHDVLPLLMAVLLLKGSMDALSKVSRTVALKSYFSGGALETAASYYNTSALAGQAVGALMGALLLGHLGMGAMLAVCGALHLAASALYQSLPAGDAASAAASRKPGAAQATDEARLRMAIVYFVAAICLYQGFHNIARSAYPVRQLGMPEAAIGLVQTLTNVAYIVGAFAAARLSLAAGRYALTGTLVHLAPLLCMVPLMLITAQAPGLAIYALFAFGFEVAYCVHLRYIITAAPAARMGAIVANSNAMALGAMVCVSFVGSWVADQAGLWVVSAAVLLLGLLAPAVAYGLSRRAAPASVPQ